MRRLLFLNRVSVVTVLALSWALGAAAQSVDDVPNPLTVPEITLDRDGMYTIDDCPTSHDVLQVVTHMNDYLMDGVKIYADGMLMQSIPIREEDAITRDVVHFLDANFDGNVDILIGPGTNREYSVLILWDREENRFARATNDGFSVFNGDFFYDPARMAVYRRTSSCFAETTYTLMFWQGTDLQSEETFLMVSDPSYYDSYHVTHGYTIRNYYSDEDIISTDDPSEIFDPWDKWILTDNDE